MTKEGKEETPVTPEQEAPVEGVITIKKKEAEDLKALTDHRVALEKRKRQLGVSYTDILAEAHGVFTMFRETRTQIQKNIKEWTRYLVKMGKKYGKDFVTENYAVDFEKLTMTPAPIKEEEPQADTNLPDPEKVAQDLGEDLDE